MNPAPIGNMNPAEPQHAPATTRKKLPHIDGLRGVAIVLVILFHCLPSVPHGYLGVDVFLVISGYLLFRPFWQDDISFDACRFLRKKFVRLWPMGLTVASVTCLCSLILFPYDLVLRTAETALAAMLGISNMYLDYMASDYFGASSFSNPLIHTWYLSVTAQVYLIACCLFLIGRLMSCRRKFILLFVTAFCSACLYFAPIWLPRSFPLAVAPPTYYLTCARLWMVIAGAMIPFLPPVKAWNRYAALGALCLLLWVGGNSCHWTVGMNGVMDLAAVGSACLCVAYGGEFPVRTILHCRPVVWVGKYSFSLYLVHWPVLVFALYAGVPRTMGNFPLLFCVVVIVSVALAMALYHGVECRNVRGGFIASCLVAGVLLCSVIIGTDGLAQYVHPHVNAVRVQNYATSGCACPVKSGRCLELLPDIRQNSNYAGFGRRALFFEQVPRLYHIGNQEKKPDFILMGDSHAEALYPGMDEFARRHHFSGIYLHSYVIPLENRFSEGLPYQRWDKEKADALISYLSALPEIKVVFIANYWSCRSQIMYRDWAGRLLTDMSLEEQLFIGLKDYVKRIRACGKEVVIFADVPMLPAGNPPGYVRRQLLYGLPIDQARLVPRPEDYQKSDGRINAFLADMEEEGLCRILHPENVMWRCAPYSAYRNGILYYKDHNHLTYPGSKDVIENMSLELKHELYRAAVSEND